MSMRIAFKLSIPFWWSVLARRRKLHLGNNSFYTTRGAPFLLCEACAAAPAAGCCCCCCWRSRLLAYYMCAADHLRSMTRN